jgi:hypothetical protein
MSQPFIKFISHTTGYLVFICLMISQILRIDHFNNPEKLSDKFLHYNQTFFNYTQNVTLKFRFQNSDLFFRTQELSVLDYICIIWIIGE